MKINLKTSIFSDQDSKANKETINIDLTPKPERSTYTQEELETMLGSVGSGSGLDINLQTKIFPEGESLIDPDTGLEMAVSPETFKDYIPEHSQEELEGSITGGDGTSLNLKTNIFPDGTYKTPEGFKKDIIDIMVDNKTIKRNDDKEIYVNLQDGGGLSYNENGIFVNYDLVQQKVTSGYGIVINNGNQISFDQELMRLFDDNLMGVHINNEPLLVANRTVNIVIAGEKLGVVKSSDLENKISVGADGTMEVNNINVNKLVQTPGTKIVIDGGTSNN